MFNKEQFIEDIKAMTVLELADLVKALEEEFGVSAAATASGGPSCFGRVAGAAISCTFKFESKTSCIGSNASRRSLSKAARPAISSIGSSGTAGPGMRRCVVCATASAASIGPSTSSAAPIHNAIISG